MIANPPRLTYSSPRRLQARAFFQANGVRSSRRQQQASTTAQLSKSSAQDSAVASVIAPGSATKQASTRASWMPVLQRASASAWSRPVRLASFRSAVTLTPNDFAVTIPNRAKPSTFLGSPGDSSSTSSDGTHWPRTMLPAGERPSGLRHVAADPFERLHQIVVGVRVAEPQIALAVLAETGPVQAGHTRLIEQRVGEFP